MLQINYGAIGRKKDEREIRKIGKKRIEEFHTLEKKLTREKKE